MLVWGDEMDILYDKPGKLKGSEQEQLVQLWQYICELVDHINVQFGLNLGAEVQTLSDKLKSLTATEGERLIESTMPLISRVTSELSDNMMSEISQTASSITSTVAATYETKTDASGKLEQAQSQIEQMANSITLRVTDNGNGSTVQITGDGVTTQSGTITLASTSGADKVALEGGVVKLYRSGTLVGIIVPYVGGGMMLIAGNDTDGYTSIKLEPDEIAVQCNPEDFHLVCKYNGVSTDITLADYVASKASKFTTLWENSSPSTARGAFTLSTSGSSGKVLSDAPSNYDMIMIEYESTSSAGTKWRDSKTVSYADGREIKLTWPYNDDGDTWFEYREAVISPSYISISVGYDETDTMKRESCVPTAVYGIKF